MGSVQSHFLLLPKWSHGTDVEATTGENLYIGTSKAEILHYVLIAPDPSDASSAPTPILASRLQPPFVSPAPSNLREQGVQQILLLPAVLKACVLCNGTLTFYSLPELSPAFGTTRVRNCNWIGGVDLDLAVGDEGRASGGEHMMIGFKDRIQLVRVGESEKPRSVKVRMICEADVFDSSLT